MFGQTNDAGAAGANAAGDLVKDTTTAGFREDVLVESTRQPVLVDFWAPWCGPCKQMTPIIERVVNAAGGKVKLVKMNIDEHPQVAGQLGIKSIPAVVAFQNGRPADGFVGALPESQIKGFIERLVGPVEDEAEALAAEAEAAFTEGDLDAAAAIFSEVLSVRPDHAGAMAGLAKILIAQGSLDEAGAFLSAVPESAAKDAGVTAARAALDLAVQAADLGDMPGLERRIAANPDDHQARFELALALNSRGRRQEAADALLLIIKRDRTWEDDRARQQLLQFFEAWGPMDPDTAQARRKLSTLLFS
ncbi:MAG: thioredoxin [Beijerinckiaceae bacterium]|nr:thioredoxin [Beijerinckiaceae bacterium]